MRPRRSSVTATSARREDSSRGSLTSECDPEITPAPNWCRGLPPGSRHQRVPPGGGIPLGVAALAHCRRADLCGGRGSHRRNAGRPPVGRQSRRERHRPGRPPRRHPATRAEAGGVGRVHDGGGQHRGVGRLRSPRDPRHRDPGPQGPPDRGGRPPARGAVRRAHRGRAGPERHRVVVLRAPRRGPTTGAGSSRWTPTAPSRPRWRRNGSWPASPTRPRRRPHPA